MGSRNEDDDTAVSGEVTTAEEKKAEEKRMAIREQNRMSIAGTIFSRLSKLPFVNVWLHKKVETSRKVVRAETELFKDLVDHDKSYRRLENIDLLLREDDAQHEANALAAEHRLAEEKRKAAARKTDDEIFKDEKDYEAAKSRMKKEYDLKILEAGYKEKLHPLEKKVAAFEAEETEQQKKTASRARSEKQKLRERAYARGDKEKEKIEKMKKATPETKAALTKAAANELEEEMEKIDKMP